MWFPALCPILIFRAGFGLLNETVKAQTKPHWHPTLTKARISDTLNLTTLSPKMA